MSKVNIRQISFEYTILYVTRNRHPIGTTTMYFPDLSCYGYRALKDANKYLNVGWLDEHHSFPTGTSDEDTLRKLFKLCQSPVAQTRGWHPCPFVKPIRRMPHWMVKSFI